MAEMLMFPSVRRRGTIQKWVDEFMCTSATGRENLLAYRLRRIAEARRRLGIDEADIAAVVKALEIAVRAELAAMERRYGDAG